MDLKALGFDIAEGVNDPYLPGDCGIFVTRVDRGSIADGRLRYELVGGSVRREEPIKSLTVYCGIKQGERLAAEDKRCGPDEQGPEAGGEGGAERRRAHQHGGAEAEVPGREAHHSCPHQPHGTQGYLLSGCSSPSSQLQQIELRFMKRCAPSDSRLDCGIGLEGGVYVTTIVQGSPAAREGSLTAGDRLIAVGLL